MLAISVLFHLMMMMMNPHLHHKCVITKMAIVSRIICCYFCYESFRFGFYLWRIKPHNLRFGMVATGLQGPGYLADYQKRYMSNGSQYFRFMFLNVAAITS